MWTKGEGMWVRARTCMSGTCVCGGEGLGLHVRVRACGLTECGHACEGEDVCKGCGRWARTCGQRVRACA